MIIYTSKPFSEQDALVAIAYKLGMLITPNDNWGAFPQMIVDAGLPVALDNGAYSAWTRERGFDEYKFLKKIAQLFDKRIPLQFIVCPDIVAGGMRSYEFSLMWRQRLWGYKDVYLAVQDGMDPTTVDVGEFTGIFVGGTKKWKLDSAWGWVQHAADTGKKCHIGGMGSVVKLQIAETLGADSVDSTSFQRNKTWYKTDQYREGMDLWDAREFTRKEVGRDGM